MMTVKTYFVVLLVLAGIAHLTVYSLYKNSLLRVVRKPSLGMSLLSSHNRGWWWQNTSHELPLDKTFTIDDITANRVPKNILKTINYMMNDTTSELGRYSRNWKLISSEHLKKFDVEATRYLENYTHHCEKSADDNEENIVRKRDQGDASMKVCPCVPPDLQGAVPGNFSVPTWPEVDAALPLVAEGGTYKPTDCRARQKVAVIIPYRDRVAPLKVVLKHLHSVLRRQQAHYGIYVVEQLPGTLFNRAFLMNVGFVEARRTLAADCYIFHDVDLISEDDRLLYRCEKEHPTHLSEYIDKYKYNRPYNTTCGGALAVPRNLFEKINGFSNQFYGWGKEDDEMYWRLTAANATIIRPPKSIARYHAVKHAREKENARNDYNIRLLNQAQGDVKKNQTVTRFLRDGLSSLIYSVTARIARKSFLHIYVEPVTSLVDYSLQPDSVSPCAKGYKVTSASLPDCAALCTVQHACAAFSYYVEMTWKQCHLLSTACVKPNHLEAGQKKQVFLMYIHKTQSNSTNTLAKITNDTETTSRKSI